MVRDTGLDAADATTLMPRSANACQEPGELTSDVTIVAAHLSLAPGVGRGSLGLPTKVQAADTMARYMACHGAPPTAPVRQLARLAGTKGSEGGSLLQSRPPPKKSLPCYNRYTLTIQLHGMSFEVETNKHKLKLLCVTVCGSAAGLEAGSNNTVVHTQ